jgi:hypothetical protein
VKSIIGTIKKTSLLFLRTHFCLTTLEAGRILRFFIGIIGRFVRLSGHELLQLLFDAGKTTDNRKKLGSLLLFFVHR